MHSKAGQLLVVGLLLAALSSLAACGNTATAGPLGAPDVIVTRAPDVTLAAGTAQVSIQSPSADATGNVNLATHSGQLTVEVGSDPDATVVMVDGVGYVKTSPQAAYARLPGPLPLSSLVNPADFADGSDEVLPSGDPWADIDLVRGTVHILSDGGAEIAGVSTIGYTLTIDPQQAIETTPAPRQAALTALLAGRTKLFTIEVWIDSHYRIRSIEVAANLVAPDFKGETPPTRDDGETIGTDVDFVSFGVSVPPVTVPAT
jgi:predicted small lipoprotein YifL